MNPVFPVRLKSARKMMGWSLQDLADNLGIPITKQALNKYESGQMKPGSDVLLALAKVLTAAGQPNQAVVLAGLNHEDTVKLLARPFSKDRRELDAVLAFLAQHGAPSAMVQGEGG